jgi:hypothetical protein
VLQLPLGYFICLAGACPRGRARRPPGKPAVCARDLEWFNQAGFIAGRPDVAAREQGAFKKVSLIFSEEIPETKRMSSLEFKRGAVLFVLSFLISQPLARISASGLDFQGKSGWVAVMYGPLKDPPADTQAGAADTDIVGDAGHGCLYTAFDDKGTPATLDDCLLFRLRVNNPTATNSFLGVAVVGIDANMDGRIDLFISVDGRKSVQSVQLLEPGTGLNISPSTTTTAPLPAGWLPNNGIYPITTVNYSVQPVTAADDPHWNGDDDLGNDGKVDVFVSWLVPMADLAIVLAKPSPLNRSGIYGPRGPGGIPGFTRDTPVCYVAFTQTQPGPINGDIGGVGASFDKNATYSALGALTVPMSPSNPVADGPGIAIDQPISGGVLGRSEDSSVSISGTSTYLSGRTLTVQATDGNSVAGRVTTIATNGTWTISGLDLSGLADGTLTIIAAADPDANPGTANDISAVATVLHDRTPPVISIDPLYTPTAGKPTFRGACDLPAGSILTVQVDPDNNPGTANLVYEVTVANGVWVLDTSAVNPISGTMPAGGLTSHAKVTTTAVDVAGNTGSATLLNRPTVNALTSNLTRPFLAGAWTRIAGDVLTVTVGGASYVLAPTGNTWSLDLATALPSSGSLGSLVGGNSYDVLAKVTRDGVSATDITTNELTITTVPIKTIAIDGGTAVSTNDVTPVISGTSQNAGGFVIVRVDPNNDGDLSDAVTYSVTTDVSGAWVLATETAAQISGIRPTAGFPGVNGILVTDSTGAVSATQVLTVALPTISIASITSGASSNAFGLLNNAGTNANWLNVSEDDAVNVSGTATAGFAVNLAIRDGNGLVIVTNGVPVGTNGSWSAANLNLSSLDNSLLQVVATLAGTRTSVTNTAVTHDKTAPRIFLTVPSTIPKSSADISGTGELPNTLLKVLIYSTNGSSLLFSNTVTTTTNGTWTINTGNGNLVSGNSGYVSVQVEPYSLTTDAAGNIVQRAIHPLQYVQNGAANTTQTISVGTIAGDDLITLAEIAGGIQITGVTSLTSAATNAFSVTVSDGVVTNAATVTSNSSGNWSASLSKAQVFALKTGPLTAYAAVTDSGSGITVYAVRFLALALNNPTLAIADNVASTATNTIAFSFTFSEVVTGFTAGDITISAGTAGAFSGSGSNYTLLVTPPANSSGTIALTVPDGAANATSTARPSVGAAASQAYNTTAAASAPSLTIDTSRLATNTAPLISGATSLQPGASVVVEVDANNDGVRALTYSATIQSGGVWSVDLSTATPSYGTFPADGLSPFARFTASAVNAYGIGTAVVGLNVPTVERRTTNDNTPLVTGIWTQVSGDTVSVTVNGVGYSVASGNLTVTSTNWSLTPVLALVDGSYDVVANVTRPGVTSAVDITTNELSIDTMAGISISGGATTVTGNPAPVISGVASNVPVGSVIALSLDIDGDAGVDLVYKTTLKPDNSWSINTAIALPVSGTMPVAGLNGSILLSASVTDPAGNTASAGQTMVVDVTPPSLAFTFNGRTSDSTPLLTGTSDLAPGSTILVQVDPNNDGGYSDPYNYTATVQAGGNWAVEATNTLGGTVGVRASASDAMGNTSTITRPLTIEVASPAITLAKPLDANGDYTLDASEDDSVAVNGVTTNLPAGTVVAVTITDGGATIYDSATVGAGGGWSLSLLNLSGMANGLITVTATCADDSGNFFSDIGTVTHQKSGIVTIDSVSQDTGLPGDFITSDSNLLFYGSAPSGASVTLSLDGPGGPLLSTNLTSSSDGQWMLDYRGVGLASGIYSLRASSGNLVTQSIVIDGLAPLGPLTVAALITNSTTPTLRGTAILPPDETLTITVNGITYQNGDNHLALNGTNWTLNIPASNALSPASGDGGFSGGYLVTAMIRDVAGNTLSSTGNVTVLNKLTQTITFEMIGDQISTGTPTLSADASSGLTVYFAVLSGPAELNGNQLSFSGTGTVSIAAFQPGDSNYEAAIPVTNTFHVASAPQAPLVFAPSPTQVFDTTNLLSVAGGSGTGAVSFAVLSGPGVIIDGNRLWVTNGTGLIELTASKASDALYASSTVTGWVTAVKAEASLTLGNLAAVYDGTPRTVSLATSPAGLTAAITYDGNADAPVNAGTYLVVATIDDSHWSGNVTGTLVVAKAPVALSLNSSANPAGYRELVTFTIGVSPGAGSLQFLTNQANLGAAVELANGFASSSTAALPRGTTLITAIYYGDLNCQPATNTLVQIITNHPPLVNGINSYRGGLDRWKIRASELLTNAVDADGDSLSLDVMGMSTNGVTVVLMAGYLQYYNTNLVDDQFVCSISDGFGGTNQATITLKAGSAGGSDGGFVGQYNTLSVGEGIVTVQFGGIPGYRYHVQRSVDMTAWESLATTNAPRGGLFQFQDTSPPQPAAFYRLMWNGNDTPAQNVK